MEPDAFDVDTPDGVTSGRLQITTAHGTRHLLDLDARTITRLPAPGREWLIEALGPFAAHRSDGVAVIELEETNDAIFWRQTRENRLIRRLDDVAEESEGASRPGDGVGRAESEGAVTLKEAEKR